MKEALELHDSDISSIETNGKSLTITFSEAYIWSDSKGWGQKATLTLENFEVSIQPSQFPLRIFDGKLYAEDNEIDNILELPFSVTGKYTIEFTFSNDEVFKAEGNNPRLELFGERRYIEDTPRSWDNPI